MRFSQQRAGTLPPRWKRPGPFLQHLAAVSLQDASPRRDEASSTNPATSEAQSTSQPAEAVGKKPTDLKPPTDMTNQDQRKEEQLDKLDALQRDIELLTDEIRQIKQQLSTCSKAFLNPCSSTIEGRPQARLDEAQIEQIEQIERRRTQLQEWTRSFPVRIDELRDRYLATSKELRQKQRELQALGRSLPEIFPPHPRPMPCTVPIRPPPLDDPRRRRNSVSPRSNVAWIRSWRF